MQQSQQRLNIWIGGITLTLFILLLIFFQSGGSHAPWRRAESCLVYAEVENVGELRVTSPVKLGGVQIGSVRKITLNPTDLRARIEMSIAQEICTQLPTNTELKIASTLPFGETFIALRVNRATLRSSESPRMKHGDSFVRAVSYQSLEDLAISLATASKSNTVDKK